jgi:hypothetical protein
MERWRQAQVGRGTGVLTARACQLLAGWFAARSLMVLALSGVLCTYLKEVLRHAQSCSHAQTSPRQTDMLRG